MYVIYPADELINILIAREHSSSQARLSSPTTTTTTTPTTSLFYPNSLSQSVQEPAEEIQSSQPRGHQLSNCPSSVTSNSVATVTTTTPNTPEKVSQAPQQHRARSPSVRLAFFRRKSSSSKNPGSASTKTNEPNVGSHLGPLNLGSDSKSPEVADFKAINQLPKQKGEGIFKRARGRSVTPTVTLTPTPGAFQDDFVHYRGQSSGNPQRVRLLSPDSTKHKSSEDHHHFFSNHNRPSQNFTGSLLTTSSGYDRRGTQDLTFYRSQSPGGAGGKMNAILGASSSNSGTMTNVPATNLVTDPTSLKDLLHPSLNETLKTHNALTFKLIRIGKQSLFSHSITFPSP